jgi:hypothetical protein
MYQILEGGDDLCRVWVVLVRPELLIGPILNVADIHVEFLLEFRTCTDRTGLEE